MPADPASVICLTIAAFGIGTAFGVLLTRIGPKPKPAEDPWPREQLMSTFPEASIWRLPMHEGNVRVVRASHVERIVTVETLAPSAYRTRVTFDYDPDYFLLNATRIK